MRMLSITTLTVLGLAIGASLANRPATNALAQAEFAQSSIVVDQLSTNTKDLAVQSFDAF